MSVLHRAHALARSGRRTDAVALVEGEAEAGDPEALHALANWRLYGLNGPRDLEAVHPLLERAAAAGHIEAARLRANLAANGTGRAADPDAARAILEAIAPVDPHAAAQLALLDAPAPAAPREEVLSDDPPIRLLRGFLSPAECRYLIDLAAPALRPSTIVDPVIGRGAPHPFRTSDGMNFGPAQEDLVVNRLNRRIAAVTGTDPPCGEPLQVLRYSPGQEYRPHLDAVPGAANQRSRTALAYLNAGYEGGETSFPELGITAKGEAGDLLIFRNADARGAGDPRTRHAGLPVTGGVKWLATRWIRERPYDPFAADAR